MSNPADSADYRSPEYQTMATLWQFVRMVRTINESIRTQSEIVLPRNDAEGSKSYATRVAMTFGFDALDETVHALVGLATREDPELQPDVPDRLKTEWEDLDGENTHGAVLVQSALELALQDGHCALLVDYPPAPEGLTLAQENALGLRAYVVLVPVDRITAWEDGRILGKKVLTMVKLQEDRRVPDGKYGTKCISRYRTLRQNVAEGVPFVTYEVEEKPADGAEYVVVESGTIRGPQWIPLHPVYGGEKRGILRSLPPLRGLAYSNLDHTQVKSDRRYSMHKCAIPFPIWRGRTGAQTGGAIVISSDVGMDVSEGGGGEYMEPKGAALKTLRDELNDIERRMGSQGFSMLRRDNPAPATATEQQMQSSREESKLARAVRSLQDAVEAALGSMAAFYGLESGGSVVMRRDFTDTFLTVQEMQFLNELNDAGKLSLRTLLAQVQASGRLLQGVDIDDEVDEAERAMAAEPLTPEPAGTVLLPVAPQAPVPIAA